MLLVIQRNPETIEEKDEKSLRVEELIDEKVERISVLQQISSTVADVLEPEQRRIDNFQGLSPDESFEEPGETSKKIISIPGAMPDLVGLSLRKGLRLLEGSPIVISIEGTGRIVQQSPPPGTPLKDNMECKLVLESQEDLSLDKLSEDTSKK
jgi:cell division protein FtsI (penicillin-binding protein 3)